MQDNGRIVSDEAVEAALSRLETIAFIGDYLPRQCGIATFTSDITTAVAKAAPNSTCWVVAMNDRPEGYRYPSRVRFEVNDDKVNEYHLAAEYLNINNCDVVCVQHEYGIFGGPVGSYVLEMLRDLNMPIVSTLHTVLKDPTPEQRTTMRKLGAVSDRMIVMSHRAVDFLRDIYGIPEEKVAFIPHGIPDVPFVDPNFYKDKFGVAGRRVILTFGLLSPNKGIENMLDALPRIVEQYPDVVYLVLGATHPHVRKHYGEDYRLGLQRRARDNGVGDNVIFHNRFVELEELVEFLGAADLYVTPYLNEQQIVSGTLAYALGTGKATISTPYWYAEEMLADERGVLVPFGDIDALADQAIALFDNEAERHAIRKRAYMHCRNMIWPEVAKQYLDVFNQAVEERLQTKRPSVTIGPFRRRPELPEVKLDHLRAMTDGVGMWQHAKFTVPDYSHGYCTDDNARGLMATALAQELFPHDPDLTPLTGTYLAFLQYAFNPDTGRFRNFMSFDRRWLEDDGSHDSQGRALWGLGYAVAYSRNRGHVALAVNLFQRALAAMEELETLRSMAFAIVGIQAYLRRYSGDSRARRVRELLTHRIYEAFKANWDDEWPWPENRLTYANAKLPQALIMAGQWMYEDEIVEAGLRSLEWLYEVQINERGHFSPVGNDGWFVRGETPARFDQQPIEAFNMVDACVEAHYTTGDPVWVERAERCMNWFVGVNELNLPLYDPTTGGCYDGLHPQGVNENQGAESSLAWLISLLTLYKHRSQFSLKSGANGNGQHTTNGDGKAAENTEASADGTPPATAGDPAEERTASGDKETTETSAS